METLVLVPHHRNQTLQIPNGFGATPSKSLFRDINCISFHSEEGVLPPPFKSYFLSSSTILSSPETPEQSPKSLKTSKSVPITFNKLDEFSSYSELWAGPTYCNSPPPSSLPIPKFSLRQKRSVSFEIPVPPSEVSLRPVAKSAPTSPKEKNNFFLNTVFATKDLRRILHLDVEDED